MLVYNFKGNISDRNAYWAYYIGSNIRIYKDECCSHIIANMADYAVTAETLGLRTCAWHAIALAHKSKCHCSICQPRASLAVPQSRTKH